MIIQQELHRMETDRNNLTRTIETLEDDVHRLQHELRETVEKMKLIVEYPSDMDAGNIGHIRKGGGGLYY